MTSIIEKRLSLHKSLENQQDINADLNLQISQLHSLANLGTATSMIAHEINNLLTPLSSYAELALNNPDDKPLIEKALLKASKNCRRASKIMESILALSNGRSEKKEKAKLLNLVEEVFTCLCRDFKRDRITVKIDIPEELHIHCIPVQIQQMLMNLILNARGAMVKAGGTLNIEADETSNHIQIRVSDSGSGIKAEDLEKIFDPFFTTSPKQNSRSQRSGTGLGLSFCKKVIDAHDGFISVESEPNKKTTFTIKLPKPQ